MYVTEYEYAYTLPPQEAYKHRMFTSPRFSEHHKPNSVEDFEEEFHSPGQYVQHERVRRAEIGVQTMIKGCDSTEDVRTVIHHGGEKRVGGARYTLGIKGPLKHSRSHQATQHDPITRTHFHGGSSGG